MLADICACLPQWPDHLGITLYRIKLKHNKTPPTVVTNGKGKGASTWHSASVITVLHTGNNELTFPYSPATHTA